MSAIPEAFKRRLRGSLAARYLVRRHRLRFGQPDWGSVAGVPVQATADGDEVLLATSVGGHLAGMQLESALAVALQLRGTRPHVLLCDADLPACLECTFARMLGSREMAVHGPRRHLCPGCFDNGAAVYRKLGVVIHRFGDYLEPEDVAEARAVAEGTPVDAVPGLTSSGSAVGEHAVAGALRFFARATLQGEVDGDRVLRRYVEAAILTARSVDRLLGAGAFRSAVFHHGIYIPQGVVGEVARARGVPVVNWNPAYRSRTFIFSHGDTYHHTLMHEPTSVWESIDFNEGLERMTMEYLASRWAGTGDWIWFHDRPEEETAAIEDEVGVDFSRPCIGMLTNVMWDAQLHYPANAFENMRDWVVETVRYFARRPQLQLLIRVHPAELRGSIPSRQPIVDEIRRAVPQLPANVFVIPPESQVSTYVAMSHCDSVIIYGTKTGVELTAMGIPVVVAGEAWVRGKGLTLDADSPDSYREILDRLPLGRRLEGDALRRARKYAFHFFFRRMIPLEFMVPTSGDPVFRLDIESAAALAPGASAGLDVVCDGILNGSPFIYPVERHTSPRAEDQ